MILSRRVQIAIALGLVACLFAAMMGVNARLSWRPATIEFATGLRAVVPSHAPIAWQSDELWLLSPFVGAPVLDTGIKDFGRPNLAREARNWNRAPLPLVVPQSLQQLSAAIATLCASHSLFAVDQQGNGQIAIWRNKKFQRTVNDNEAREDPPDFLSLSPDGTLLASESDLSNTYSADSRKPEFCNYGVTVYDVATGRRLARQSAFEGAFSDVAWSPDSREIAALSVDGWVFVFGARSAKLRLKFRAHQLFGAHIAWSRDGNTLVTATNPRLTITPRDLKYAFKSGNGFVLSGGYSRGVATGSDGKNKVTLVTNANGDSTWNGRTERSLKRFDARTGQPIGAALPLKTGAVDLAFSPDGRELAIGEHEFALVLDARTLKTNRLLTALPAPKGLSIPAPVCIAWSDDGATLATSTVRGLTLWRMR